MQGLTTLKALGQSSSHGAMGVLAVNILTSGMITLGLSAGAGVALGWGALRVSQGTLDLPTLLVVLMLGVEVFCPLRELSRLYHRGMIAASTAKAIFAILDAIPAVQEPHEPARLSVQQAGLTPELRFEGVHSGYLKRSMVQPLIPSPMGWRELWRRLLSLVQDWWAQLGITFV